MQQPIRSYSIKGVTVSVVLSEKAFDVFVEISEGCNLALRRKNRFFSVKFHTDGKIPVAKERMLLELHCVEYPSSNFVVNFKQTLFMANNMSCIISLAPEFYLSPALLKACQKQREKGRATTQRKKQKKADEKALAQFYRSSSYGSSKIRPSSQATINGKPAINYSRNNVFKPHQGGGCTSK